MGHQLEEYSVEIPKTCHLDKDTLRRIILFTNVGKTMPSSTHDWEWVIPSIYGEYTIYLYLFMVKLGCFIIFSHIIQLFGMCTHVVYPCGLLSKPNTEAPFRGSTSAKDVMPAVKMQFPWSSLTAWRDQAL